MPFQLGPDLFFPPPDRADKHGLLASGGDLSAERLLLAYSSGIFPWYEQGSPILWWCPNIRAVVKPHEVHISRSLGKFLKKSRFSVRYDSQFDRVIQMCASVPRAEQHGTWILKEMQKAYQILHRMGYAHSVEVYQEQSLVGGLYGVSLGGVFCGESMFSCVPNASKVAFVHLARTLAEWGFDLIDCQLMNDYLKTLGAYECSREDFLNMLSRSLQKSTKIGPWIV